MMSKALEIKRKHEQRIHDDDLDVMVNIVMEHQEERVQARRREEAERRRLNEDLAKYGLPVRIL